MYEYRCIVKNIVDGDTVDVDIDLGFDVWLNNQRVRLYGIDTPESRTRDSEEKKYGKLASEYVAKYLEVGKPAVLKTHKDDKGKFGRILGEFLVHDSQTNELRSLNEMLVENHLAVEYYGQSKQQIEQQHINNRQLVDLNIV